MRVQRYIAAGLLTLASTANAGQVTGTPATTPVNWDSEAEFYFGNDFLGRGGASDDYRTTQLMLSARINPRWSVIVDHSMLTLEEPAAREGPIGRVDQLTAHLAWRWLDRDINNRRDRVTLGFGVRATGNYGGTRITNGFHRLINDSTPLLPYTDTDEEDATAWLQAMHSRPWASDLDLGWFGSGWESSWQADITTLVTTDGQSDGTLGLSAQIERGGLSLWAGIRGDWREGYDQDNVLEATAENEDGGAAFVGFKYGPLIIETVQNFDTDAAYGRLSVVSGGEPVFAPASEPRRFGIQTGLTVPVYAQLQGRWSLGRNGPWRTTALGEFRYGEPPISSREEKYRETYQATAGIEFERLIDETDGWVSWYNAIGGGWRQEQLQGNGDFDAARSARISRAVLTADTGLRFGTAAGDGSWSMDLQVGLTGWYPLEDADVAFAGDTETLQEPGYGLLVGVLFRLGDPT